MEDHIRMRPVGYISSPVTQGIDTGWGQVASRIILSKEFESGLRGMDTFSHAVVVFYMHESDFNPEDHLVRRPQGRPELPLTGIFAQRAKHRPNPVGITAVTIVSCTDNILTVTGLDAIDGTPVLDIKPYVPEFDCRTDCTVPDWIQVLMGPYF